MPLIYITHLFEYLWYGISFGDVALFLILITAVLKIRKKDFVFRKAFLILIAFWAVMGIFGVLNITKNYFDYGDFFLAYVKFTFYIICLIIIPTYFSTRIDHLSKIVKRSLWVLCLLGLYQVIAHYFFPFLPYDLSPPTPNGSNNNDIVYSYNETFRIDSIFSEPAHFAFYINLLYFFLITNKNYIISKSTHLVTISTILLTMSMSGLILLIVNVGILILNRGIKVNKKQVTGGILVLLFLIIFLSTNDYVTNRIVNIASLDEGSGVARLLGSWEIAFKTSLNGVGIGNMINFGESLPVNTLDYTDSPDKVHNIFAVVLLIGGYLGFFLFLLFNFAFTYKSFNRLLFVIAFGFASGVFNNIPFWLLLILISSLDLYERKFSNV